MALILIVEDEKRIRDIVADYVVREGHEAVTACDGVDALAILKGSPVDLMILDIMMPNLDGYSVCKIAREMSGLPIILLTARQDEQDKLRGYELGADDYVTKPFSPRVLMAKVRVLLRRTGQLEGEDGDIRAGKIAVNPTSRSVSVEGRPVELTHTEYELLLLFVRNPGQVFSREQLLNRVWGYDFAGSSRTVDVHVKNLRRKLGDEGRHIVTLIRSGYKFEVMADE